MCVVCVLFVCCVGVVRVLCGCLHVHKHFFMFVVCRPKKITIHTHLRDDDAPPVLVREDAPHQGVLDGALARGAPRRQHVGRVGHHQRDRLLVCRCVIELYCILYVDVCYSDCILLCCIVLHCVVWYVWNGVFFVSVFVSGVCVLCVLFWDEEGLSFPPIFSPLLPPPRRILPHALPHTPPFQNKSKPQIQIQNSRSRSNASRSNASPSTGSSSIFQSPVWTIVP